MPNKWQFAHLRFTVFSADPVENQQAIFESFFRFPSESQSTQKATFITELSARRDNVVYQLSAVGPKLDLVVAPAVGAGTVPNALPVLGAAKEIRDSFVSASAQLAEELGDARRFAVGEQLLFPASSRSEAYKRMADFLPSVKVDPEKSSDFLYRINRPRKQQVGKQEVVVNRLSHWGCILMVVSVTAGDITQTIPLGDAVSLTTDVNSAPETDVSVFGKPERKELVETLFAFSSEIAEKGDIA